MSEPVRRRERLEDLHRAFSVEIDGRIRGVNHLFRTQHEILQLRQQRQGRLIPLKVLKSSFKKQLSSLRKAAFRKKVTKTFFLV